MDSTLQKVRGLTKEPIETISTNPTYGKFEHGDALDKITQEVRAKLEEELDEESLKVLPKAVGMVRKQEDRRWQTTLPDDILSNISDLLPLSDFINFRGVCRNWRRVPSCRSNITELSKKDPWCILYNFDARDKDMCLFYQWNSRKSCNVKLPGLRGAKCFVSKRGWLFIRRNNDYLLFNPLTLEEIFLPDYPVKSSGLIPVV